jgi:hypothetical protein
MKKKGYICEMIRKLILFLFLLKSLDVMSQINDLESYFYEIAYKNEFNSNTRIKKWDSDVKFFICDYKKDIKFNDSIIKTIDTLEIELSKIINDLNNIIEPINFIITNDSTDANFFLYLGSSDWYNLNVPQTIPYTGGNYGLGWVTQSNGIIKRSDVYVDLYRVSTIKEKKHLLREEITQSLGLFNDSWKYSNSIFYQGWTDVTEYSDIDIQVISKLYN